MEHSGVVVQRLAASHRDKIVRHLLRLPPPDRRVRFGAVLHATNRGYRALFMHCLAENQIVMHLVRKAGLHLVDYLLKQQYSSLGQPRAAATLEAS